MKIAPCVATEQISKRDQAHCCLDILVSLSVSLPGASSCLYRQKHLLVWD